MEKKFKMVGYNKYFKEIHISEPVTIDDIFNSKYESFFSITNRGDEKSSEYHNCKFLGYFQYTGKKDKHLEDIYEGDIIENGLSGVHIVVLDKGGFTLCCLRDTGWNEKPGQNYTFSYINQEAKIIGNMFTDLKTYEYYKKFLIEHGHYDI